jgi:hypothetical protein
MRRLRRACAKIEAKFAVEYKTDRPYQKGMAREGWDGGYLAALQDVEAMISHGHPTDSRGYWKDDRLA